MMLGSELQGVSIAAQRLCDEKLANSIPSLTVELLTASVIHALTSSVEIRALTNHR